MRRESMPESVGFECTRQSRPGARTRSLAATGGDSRSKTQQGGLGRGMPSPLKRCHVLRGSTPTQKASPVSQMLGEILKQKAALKVFHP